ncbi:hypothetical protein I2I05_10420 [Hymenobacter sp. BT683]|uniref:DUF4249 family protein n=1 Tax=Hymenobacter jeongseonensis TaxID=2791027 RepID=A0ABS0IHI3_9BACT|nr:hypothetical protein [Hymenobacter jeongseonensis]MBF9237808.1 hypothetical protein [Hymenobacter jeongseonensis]
MTYPLPNRFATACCLSLLLLSGCCANDVCDCQDEQADAVQLSFSPAFGTADLDTIIILRSPLPYLPTNKVETVTLIRTAAQLRDSIRLNNTTPFTQVGSTKLNGYRYAIQYLVQKPGAKPVPITALVIDSVRLSGSLAGDGCCTCYTNAEKTVYATRPKRTGTGSDSTFVVDLKQVPAIPVTK